MSEKIYVFLIRLFPADFRRTYGEESLQLFRDRSRDERGLWPGLRLWFDLLTDLAVSIPVEYRHAQPALAGDSGAQQVDGMPGFELLETTPLRPAAFLSAAFLSFATFAAISVLIVHGGSYRALWLHGAQDQRPDASRASSSVRSAQPSKGAGHQKLMSIRSKEDPTSEVAAPGSGNLMLVSLTSAQRLLPGNPAFAQSNRAQIGQPTPQDATTAMIRAFDSHNIVMFGENHGVKQEYEWLDKLVSTPQFADRVDDIVVEFGNSLYQKSVDRYIAGEDVPIEQVQKAWQNMIGAVGPPSPVYAGFYKAVRDENLKRRGKHQIRLVLGDPYGDWDRIKKAEDLGPYLANRDQWYAQVVKDEVVARNHRALLIMGAGHFLRRNGPGYVEREIRAAGANPYLVVFGTNAIGAYDDLDPRFDAWTRPAIVSLAGNWVGELPSSSVTTGGSVPATQLKLADAADALLYVAPRDALTQVNMTRSELERTAYEKELNRRMMIMTGRTLGPLPTEAEAPMFHRPQPQLNAGGQNALPPPPQTIHDPLPPRPPSR